MPEPDFAGLLAEVEAATRVPQFDGVTRRAGRARRRDRGVRLLIALLTLGALVPAGLVGVNAAPGRLPSTAAPGGGDTGGRARPVPEQPERDGSQAPAISTIRAVAGLRLTAVYAAVDVCRPGATRSTCSLQVVPLGHTAQDQRPAIVVDELREDPGDPLQDVTLISLSPQSLLLSGIRADGQRASRRISVGGGGAAIEAEPSGSTGPRPGDRLVQLTRNGELYFVRQADDRLYGAVPVPGLTDTAVVSSVPPEHGWWVTGTESATGQAAVAVSHDHGTSWTVRSLGVRPGFETTVVATGDGVHAHAFVRTAAGIEKRRSVDGGATWQVVTAILPWPRFSSGGDVVTRRLGAVVRTDGTLLVWVDDAPAAVFLESVDGGLSYRPTNGPTGPILALADGYLALGDPPVASRDGRTWSALARPAVVAPS